MKDAYYFPHDANARNDERVMYLRSKYGLSAYSIFFMMVEIMHEQSDGKLSCKLLDGLCQQLNVDKTLLNDFYNDSIECGLFKTDGEKYWSDRVLRNKQHLLEIRGNKSKAGKIGALVRWNKSQENGTGIADEYQSHNSAITENSKVKESKVNKSKVKEIFIPPTLTEVINYCNERKNNVNAEKWHSFYSSNGWKVGKNSMKDWKAAVRTWENSETKQQPKQTKFQNFEQDKPDFNEMMRQAREKRMTEYKEAQQ